MAESEKNPEKRVKHESDDKGIAKVVANHYNCLDESGLAQRKQSRIFFMRNFNNWMKSMLLNEYIDKIRQKDPSVRISALDMGCGKGGDLNKWGKARTHKLVCADIADVSVKQAESRYKDLIRRHRGRIPFDAEFITADCTKERLKDKYAKSDQSFDLVSCQFALHYCFESLPQAECMIRNAAECLKPGGYFIGTTPDAYDIVGRVRATEGKKTAGNKFYSVTFDSPLEDDTVIPLFGAKYNFHLEGVVDCPEFLVHFPTLVRIAKKFGLSLVKKWRFGQYFDEMKGKGRHLLSRMNALEVYPPVDPSKLDGEEEEEDIQQYADAREFLKQFSSSSERVGTMSKDEWEATNVYVLFAFQKI